MMSKIGTFYIAAMSFCLTACNEKQERKVEPMSVETEVVSDNYSIEGKKYVGTVEEESSTLVSFTGSGSLTRIYVYEGKVISKGQLIAEKDKTDAHNMVIAAEAQMRQANDALVRMQQLHDNGSLAEIKWIETLSKVDQAKAQLDLAKKQFADCSLYAPVSGVIGKNVMDVGETVLPSMPVASILNINKVKVVVSIPEKEISRFSKDTQTTTTVDALGGRSYCGGLITKGVEADDITHTYDIKISVQNKDHSLLPGMVCKVEVQNDKRLSQISVPITAVRKDVNGGKFVWTVRGNKAHRSEICTGRSSGNRIVVEKGIKKGDEVIVEGYQKLNEGTILKKIVRNE